MALMNMVSHGTQDMYPPFSSEIWGWGPQARAALKAFSQVGALAVACCAVSIPTGWAAGAPSGWR